MKAILLDPNKATVQSIDIDGSIDSICKAIKCRYFTVACDLPNGDTIYVDDEGLYNSDTDFFNISHGFQPYAGRAVILNTDTDGNTRAVKSTVEDILQDAIFIPRWYMVARSM